MSSFTKLAGFVALAALAAPALAHIEMQDPAPLRSSFNQNYAGGTVQDTYTNPLKKDGSNFPCWGFQSDVGGPVSKPVATLNAGSEFTVKLAGSAVHGGGSCQFSISYDGGATFGVMHQVVGGCPTEGAAYSFTVPAGLPSANSAIMAWTWFNKVGNREMYMNCAEVSVMGASGSLELPKMFEANHFGDQCTTPDSADVDFAAPTLNNCSGGQLVTPDMKVTVGSGAPAPVPPVSNSTMTGPTDGGLTTAPGPATTTGTIVSTGAPATTTGTSSTPPATGGADAWAADKVYVGGATACFSGVSYTAKWWTQAEEPGKAEVWTAGGAC